MRNNKKNLFKKVFSFVNFALTMHLEKYANVSKILVIDY